MEIATATEFISGVGFPIFVALFLLLKTTVDSRNQIKALNELTNAINIMSEGMKK